MLWKIDIFKSLNQSAPLPKSKVSSRLGSYVVAFLDPNGRNHRYKSELELKYIRILEF